MSAICLTVNVSDDGSPPGGEGIFEIVDFKVLTSRIEAGKEMRVQVDLRNRSAAAGEAIVLFRQGAAGVVIAATNAINVPGNTTMRTEIAFNVPTSAEDGPMPICAVANDVATNEMSEALCVTVNVNAGAGGGATATSVPWWLLAAVGLVAVGAIVTRKPSNQNA